MENKCGNCFWYNGDFGDGVQFCDYMEYYVNENNYCIHFKAKREENNDEQTLQDCKNR